MNGLLDDGVFTGWMVILGYWGWLGWDRWGSNFGVDACLFNNEGYACFYIGVESRCCGMWGFIGFSVLLIGF